ncbi:hypothetical protein JQS43_05120 [Natronosporangium hydrolyticum]|uniref:Uncharacterized protein n=1 Tax=Natronosporangium hydrolyticum TaxID=2811111 RepID=A0A895YI46_9ACTN|nr:hypothetical protein [Natronosporangium hydrolyticum]QSB15722.1 hypothetical protein JQS43_05120 [Natronosporangium hydrolyticum]
MTSPQQSEGHDSASSAGPPSAPQSTPFGSTPNAERYLLEADNLRRRQLRSALLHGSSRTWRDRRRIWPAVVAGVILVAIISAAIAVTGTFQNYRREQREEQREREEEQRQREEEQQQRDEEFEQQRREQEEQRDLQEETAGTGGEAAAIPEPPPGGSTLPLPNIP